MRRLFTFRNLRIALVVVVGGFALMQLVPYRVTNPSVTGEPPWDSPRTRQLAVAACFDCHSNETKTPWYAKVAPVSWLARHHVDDGRSALNFSEWDRSRGEGAHDAIETIQQGSMPPSYYTWFGLHSNARLSKSERDELIRGLRTTFQNAGVRSGSNRGSGASPTDGESRDTAADHDRRRAHLE